MAFLPKSVSAPVHNIARHALGKNWQLYGVLLEHWSAIVGESWADLMAPVKLGFPGHQAGGRLRDGVLTIRLPRGMALEAQYQQPQILSRVNGFLGDQAVSRILFVHALEKKRARPLKPFSGLAADIPPRVVAAVAPVQDDALRLALLGLGEAMHSG